jgi:hypothetical protein
MQIRIHESFSKEKNTSITETEDYLIVKEKYAMIKNIFNQLPDQQKIVLHLSKEKGWKRAEIAACLQLSPNTVKLHLHRAMQFMKHHLPCMSIFILLFILNIIFFRNSSTKEDFKELFIRKNLSSEMAEIFPNMPLLKISYR